jgi:hypothetical protein
MLINFFKPGSLKRLAWSIPVKLVVLSERKVFHRGVYPKTPPDDHYTQKL